MQPRSPVHLERKFPSPADLARSIPEGFRWPIVVVLGAVAGVYAFSCLRVQVRPWNDFAFIYSAGRTWLQGVSPYDFERWNAEWVRIRPPATVVSQPMPFMYPPHWAPLAMALAALPWPLASRVWDVTNVVTFVAACFLALKLLPSFRPRELRQPAIWAFLALATLNPALHYAVWQSQMTVLPTMGIIGTFWAWQQRRSGWLALFGFIASLKPQIGLPALLYVFVNGGYVGLLWSAAAAVVVSLLAMLPTHVELWPDQFAHCYSLHMQVRFNDPAEFFSVPALAPRLVSPHLWMRLGPVLSSLGVIAVSVWRRRSPELRSDPILQLCLVAALTGALMPIHGYDLVIYTPLLILVYELGAQWLGALLALLVLAVRPDTLARYLHVPIHPAYMTGAIAGVTLLVALQRCREARRLQKLGGGPVRELVTESESR
jgi:hypothetical protein